jgi:hypothetical protein
MIRKANPTAIKPQTNKPKAGLVVFGENRLLPLSGTIAVWHILPRFASIARWNDWWFGN